MRSPMPWSTGGEMPAGEWLRGPRERLRVCGPLWRGGPVVEAAALPAASDPRTGEGERHGRVGWRGG